MRRNLLGILAAVLITVGLVLISLNVNDYVANSAWRIGLVLGALWLALPQLQQTSRWLARAAIGIAVVAALFSKYALILLPLLALLWVFGPCAKSPASGER